MNTDLDGVLGDLQAHLQRLKDDGVKSVQVSRETLAALSAKVAPAKPWSAQAKLAPSPPEAQLQAPKAEAPLRHSRDLSDVTVRIRACTTCRLAKTRTNVVPGQGNANQPDILFVGEGPGADEDAQGLAFVGRAGQLLTKMIEAMGYTRDQVFIGNVVKCRPPDNRVPLPDEMESCLPFLREQISIIQPKLIVALGATAMKGLFGENVGGITKIRGRWMEFQGIPVMPTYHPAYLLRNPPAKREVWEDLKAVLAKLGRTVPAGRGQ
jgi:uracil-DNA glycosylase family 4